uniref:Uncharacterized protein n=1 Tax=Euplotes crassus TaxID=5936 RepID=A0A7S3NXC7_EUPCR|mmetsp:Transcript_4155/g.3906  ORF Transcript_4155/g.3906 Transcript_4155/m.3906 type:complete len:127 (+) Transcript_4155:102-482(+)
MFQQNKYNRYECIHINKLFFSCRGCNKDEREPSPQEMKLKKRVKKTSGTMFREKLARKETTKFKPVPQVIIDFILQKHKGNWAKTTDLVNKRYSNTDGSVRTFNSIELKRSYENTKKKQKRRSEKN